MYMVWLVLDVAERLDAVLDAWRAAGVGGATFAETMGVRRRQLKRGRVPARYAIGGLAPGGDNCNYTVWAIVPDEDTVRRCLAAAESVVGDLDGPDTGVFAAWPLLLVKGVPQRGAGGAGGQGAPWPG